MKILFLTNLLPYPLNNGGKIKSFYTIKSLASNHSIDLVTFVNSDDDFKYVNELKKIVNNVYVIKKTLIRNSSKIKFLTTFFLSLYTDKPYVIYKFWSQKMFNLLQQLQSLNNYDLVYIDHLPMMIYKDLFQNKKLVLDQHNVESLIIKRYALNENSIIKKFLGLLEYKKLEKFEKKMMSIADRIIVLSEEDKKIFNSMVDNIDEKMSVIPICIESNYKKTISTLNNKKTLKILFMGTMSWFPNQHGIEWFVKNVFSKLNKEDFELYIVGNSPSKEILKWNRFDNIHVTGYVEDINYYIELCDVNVVPLFIGSGMRVKIIESFSKGIPTISTTIGAEGIKVENWKNIIIADDAKTFIDCLVKLQKHREILTKISENAYQTFVENYSLTVLENKLGRVIKSVKENV